MIDATTKRNIYALAITVLGLSYIPAVGPMLTGMMNYPIGGTQITVGTVIGGIALWSAYLMYKRWL